MKFITKWLTKPVTNETEQIEVAQLWYVKWYSRDGAYSSCVNKEMEAFPSEQQALDFAESLRKAFKLLKHTGSETHVVVEKN